MENERSFHYQRVWGYYDKDTTKAFFKRLGTINSFLEFRANPLVGEFLGALSPIAGTADINSQAQIFFHLYQMFMHGEKIIKVAPDLALQLYHTEVRGVKAEHLRAPFREQYIDMPHGLSHVRSISHGLDNRSIDKGESKTEGVYVFLNRSPLGEHEFRILIIGTGNEKAKNQWDDAVVYFRFYMKDEDEVQQVVDKVLRESINEPESIIAGGDYNYDRIPSILNFVINVLLYSTSPNADFQWQSWKDIDPKIKKLQGKKMDERKAELKKKHMLAGVLGGTLKLRHEERALYESLMRGGGKPIGVAVLVRGHWRNQWYGSDSDGTRVQKPKFIEPFWKSMNNDIISNKIHLLE